MRRSQTAGGATPSSPSRRGCGTWAGSSVPDRYVRSAPMTPALPSGRCALHTGRRERFHRDVIVFQRPDAPSSDTARDPPDRALAHRPSPVFVTRGEHASDLQGIASGLVAPASVPVAAVVDSRITRQTDPHTPQSLRRLLDRDLASSSHAVVFPQLTEPTEPAVATTDLRRHRDGTGRMGPGMYGIGAERLVRLVVPCLGASRRLACLARAIFTAQGKLRGASSR
jgi:hypothetical protein